MMMPVRNKQRAVVEFLVDSPNPHGRTVNETDGHLSAIIVAL
jgi:hypothetical protein